MSRTVDVKAELTQSLKYLHLPTVRQCYEEVARQAERESLSYERYLHELVQRECEERQENRIANKKTDDLKSRAGHIVVRVEPGGEAFAVHILSNADESDTVTASFGPIHFLRHVGTLTLALPDGTSNGKSAWRR